MKSPIVSVTIPSYNGALFIGEAISSVLNQTFSNWELIICDDCSSDDTVEIIKSFKDPRIRFYSNRANLGISGNSNKCIELSSGRYIQVLDQDDVLLPFALEKKVKLLDKNIDVGIVHTNIYRIDAEGNIIGGHWIKNHCQDFIENGFLYFKRLLLNYNIICGSSVMFRKECFDKLGGNDLRLTWTHDYELWMRYMLHFNIAYLSEPLLYYRWHSSNVSHKYKNNLKAIEEEYLARIIVIEKKLEKFTDIKGFKREVKKYTSEDSLKRANQYYNDKNKILALKYIYFAIKLYPNCFKNYYFKKLVIKMLLGTKGINLFYYVKNYFS